MGNGGTGQIENCYYNQDAQVVNTGGDPIHPTNSEGAQPTTIAALSASTHDVYTDADAPWSFQAAVGDWRMIELPRLQVEWSLSYAESAFADPDLREPSGKPPRAAAVPDERCKRPRPRGVVLLPVPITR